MQGKALSSHGIYVLDEGNPIYNDRTIFLKNNLEFKIDDFLKNGAVDETRTRDPLRDRQVF